MASSVLITTASLVLLALLMVHIASFTGPAGVTERVHNTIDGGVFSMRGVEVPLPSSFTGIPAIDGWLSIVVVVFSQLQLYPADPPAYWQSLVFLTELAGVYAIFLAESCRDVNRSTVLRW
ncbi:hypothetical protein GMORB2_2392 [Geosmithia morbida]|uniref:Uncharacterized protein n=1 Tax=Geosmithia morbida TaxID=1094350 RepID=A0A9P4YPT7_9HYPO|nr:uncharacterized protein GMORB2_2392 [Geosmithia morbida]KAF4120906.1 hypothetical protein GMORB2_2392 [Geosmithia morbida]